MLKYILKYILFCAIFYFSYIKLSNYNSTSYFVFVINEQITISNIINYFYIYIFWLIPGLFIYIDILEYIDKIMNPYSYYLIFRFQNKSIYMNYIIKNILKKCSIYFILIIFISLFLKFEFNLLHVANSIVKTMLIINLYIIISIIYRQVDYKINIYILFIIVIHLIGIVSNFTILQELLLGSNSVYIIFLNICCLILEIYLITKLSKRMEL